MVGAVVVDVEVAGRWRGDCRVAAEVSVGEGRGYGRRFGDCPGVCDFLTFFLREILFYIEVGIVVGGVHASVRAPAARDGNALTMQQHREAFFQNLLYRNMVGLYLPTIERRSVVGQMKKVTH